MTEAIDRAHIYTDISGLDGLRLSASKNDPKALKGVAKQFESMYLNMILDNMREANETMGADDNYLNSDQTKMYNQMFDRQIAQNMTQGHGVGLADTLYQQLNQQINKMKVGATDRTIRPLNALDKNTMPIETISGAATASNDDALLSMQQGLINQTELSSPVPVISNTAPEPVSFDSKEHFVEHLYPIAQQVAGQLGVDPKLLLAQAALETGWGRSVIQDNQGKSSHNLFGIKADNNWNGNSVVVSTVEYRDNIAQREKAAFRSYDSYEQSFTDYANYLHSQTRYQTALQNAHSPEAFANELQQAGYATDPEYGQKIADIYNSDTLKSAGRG